MCIKIDVQHYVKLWHKISDDQCRLWFHVLLPERLLTLTSTVQTKLQTVHIWEPRNKIYWLFLVNLKVKINLIQREYVLYSYTSADTSIPTPSYIENTNVRHQVVYIELLLDEISSISKRTYMSDMVCQFTQHLGKISFSQSKNAVCAF